MTRPIPIRDRLFRHVTIADGDACWEWTGFRTKKGYGSIWVSGGNGKTNRYRPAHRVSWEIHHGTIQDEALEVCHRCDNPPCVRPDHLFLGTTKENAQDRDNKRRHRGQRGKDHVWKRRPELVRRGSSLSHAKLTEEAVRQLRAAVAGGMSRKEASCRFGVSASQVGAVVLREAWAHVIDNFPPPKKRRSGPRRRRLSDDDVAAIKIAHKAGELRRDIAARFGISRGYVSQVVNGWRRSAVRGAP